MRCLECGGTGLCRACRGTGLSGEDGSPAETRSAREHCSACDGSGVCPACHGMGDTGRPSFENADLYGFR